MSKSATASTTIAGCCSWNRRALLKAGVSCGAYLAALTALSPAAVRQAFAAPGEKLFRESWGWIEPLAEGVWAHISTPFEARDYTTVCNGGIVAGTKRVLAIEAYQKPEGARWMAERAKALTGRWPTDFVITHFHGDHCLGSSGYHSAGETPRMWLTGKTKQLVAEGESRRDRPVLVEPQSLIEGKATKLDLGGRSVTIHSSGGHTPSDVVIEVSDPHVMFCGDLLWNKLVPNFRDAGPKQLTASVAGLLRDDKTRYVPGHGTMANLDDVKRFQAFLETMEQAATAAHQAGTDADAAAQAFKLPEPFADWYVFADTVMPAIFKAWYAELSPAVGAEGS